MINPLDTLETAFGFWNALVLLAVFIIAMIISHLIYRRGNAGYQKRTMQTLPFMSGNRIDDAEAAHISSDNVYWGFLEIFKGYYDRVEEAHTGNLTDYLHWFVVVLAVLFMVVIVGGA